MSARVIETATGFPGNRSRATLARSERLCIFLEKTSNRRVGGEEEVKYIRVTCTMKRIRQFARAHQYKERTTKVSARFVSREHRSSLSRRRRRFLF